LNYAYEDVIGDWNKIDVDADGLGDGYYMFQHDLNPDARWAGLTLANTKGLDEVVVMAAARTIRRELSGSVSGITIRGNAVISDNKLPVVVNGILCPSFRLDSIDQNEITSINILKGGEAATLYGSDATNGVIVITTKDYLLSKMKEEIPVVTRKNFNESAFFFPAIHADKDGFYSFSFTMPESVTEWNWKMLANTKNSLFAYAERKLNTQLPLMVQPNMPRLLYQGDRIVLQSRISNLDTINAQGKISCKILDAVTDEDITSKCLKTSQNNFAVIKKSNNSFGFELKMPIGQVNPVKITITARAENFADAEEHTIPVLTPNVFVRESKNFYFSKNSDTTLSLSTLPADAKVYGIGLSIQPRPQAALINSLPYLANYPWGCAEQTFNKLLAYTIAYKLMRTDSNIQRSFSNAKQVLEKEAPSGEKLPGELSDETMPWLGLANHHAQQYTQLFDLLDTSRATIVINDLLGKLYKLQNPDGGLAWFNGGKSDFYISNYVLKGFGKLVMDQQLIPGNSFNVEFYEFTRRLVNYCDRGFGSMRAKDQVSNVLYYAYGRSYFLNTHPLTDSLNQQTRKGLLENWKNTDTKSLYGQSLLVIGSFRFSENEKDELFTNAVTQLNSIRQVAIVDEQNGLRWKDLADNDDLTNSSEETIALLAEAFNEPKIDSVVNRGIIKWLLTAKSEHHWSNTKATAAAINLLSNEKISIGEAQVVNTTGTRSIVATDDMFNGADFSFSRTNEIPAVIQLHKENRAVANGSFYSYYFTSSTNVNGLNKDVQVLKQCYKWNAKDSKWEIISDGTQLKIADKIRVVMTIQSAKALQYVFIDDKRAAAFEPANNNSGYEYGTGFSYYRSVRDAGFQFFADFVPSGKTEISYELKVAQEGEFLNGPAVLQCMYKPEVTVYSNSFTVKTEK
jgi:TonB-dependent SusC/RagA subfamily outer membrane receptor